MTNATQPFRHLLESVYAIEDDKTVPLPVVLPGGLQPRTAKAAYALPAKAPPPRIRPERVPTPVEVEAAPVARHTQENVLLVTKSSRLRAADAPSTDVDHSAETFNKEDETPRRPRPASAMEFAIDLSLDSLDVIVPDDGLNARLAALPLLSPVGGAHDGLVVARGEATGIWSQKYSAPPSFGDDSFNRLLEGPDDWFDVPLVEGDVRPVVASVPTVDIRPLPERAVSLPDVPVVVGELVPVPPLVAPRPRRPIAPTIPTPAPQMEAAPRPRARPQRLAPRPNTTTNQREQQKDRAVEDRLKLAREFYHVAIGAIAERKYADALARLAGAHNLDPENARYTAMIEDVKAMMRRAA